MVYGLCETATEAEGVAKLFGSVDVDVGGLGGVIIHPSLLCCCVNSAEGWYERVGFHVRNRSSTSLLEQN